MAKGCIVLNMKNTLNRFLIDARLALALCVMFVQPVYAQAESDQRSLFHQELAKEAQVWLESQGEKFMALWEPDTSGSSFGAILLLHGEGQTADWPDTINPLRTTLMQFGWSTLSIELPDSVVETSANETRSAEDIEAIAQARIQAAVNFLDSKGQFNLVLFGVGQNAKRGMSYLLTQPAQPEATKETGTASQANTIPTRGAFRALIMVNVRELTLNPDFRLPTLDLYYDEHFLDKTEVKERKLLAEKFQLPFYHQLRLLRPEAPAYGEENRLTRRVRGFLNKYAKGVEVKRK